MESLEKCAEYIRESPLCQLQAGKRSRRSQGAVGDCTGWKMIRNDESLFLSSALTTISRENSSQGKNWVCGYPGRALRRQVVDSAEKKAEQAVEGADGLPARRIFPILSFRCGTVLCFLQRRSFQLPTIILLVKCIAGAVEYEFRMIRVRKTEILRLGHGFEKEGKHLGVFRQ